MDELVFHKAKTGNPAAFEELISSYEKLIFNASYRMMGNTQDAEDISQEVIIKVYKNLAACKSAAAFKSWLFRIINNSCIDEMRRRKGKTALSLDASQNDGESYIENPVLRDDITPESEYLRKDTNKKIQQAIDNLPPDYKAVIVMRDINGMSYEEIAEVLALSMGTVKSRIARGRKKLMLALSPT